MNKHLRWFIMPSLLMGTTLNALSEKVSLSDAEALAIEFVRSRTGNPTGPVSLQPVLTAGTEKAPLYYVFNLEGNSGFVMISGETSTTPVLGYSFNGGYPVKNMPDGMKWMLAGIEKEIKAAPSIQTSKTSSDLKKAARKAAGVAAKKELATPKWSQEGPFNAMIPGRPLVGCVGTAMATIMKYYEHPAAGAGNFGGVDFATSYDWSNMRMDNYRSGYSSAEGDAVATLMYHASKSIDTQYAMSGSSAYEVRVPGALSTYFGYDPGVSYKKRSEVATQAEWDAIVRNEIDNGRPVLYCGQDVSAGHAFVCDGYEGEYFHFNWGWGGSADGYFTTTALNPTVSRTHQYNNLNTIIYNIKPASGAIGEWSPIHITADGNQAGIGSDLTDLASGQKFTVRVGNLKNITHNDFAGKIAVALCDSNGKMKALLSAAKNLSMQSMGYLFDGYMDFTGCALPSGVSVASGDRVRIMTQASGQGAWLPVAGELLTVNELDPNTSTPSSFMVVLPSVQGATVEGAASVIRGWNYSFKVNLANPNEDVATVKANGITLVPVGNTYTIPNVRQNQEISILIQKAADVKEKRSIWVGAPGTLSSIIPESETGTIKDLTLFGTLDARDFQFMRDAMNLRRLDLSGVTITANGSDQANAIPREAFRGKSSLKEVILPNSVNRLNNGCFRQSGITSITIPANISKYEYNIFVGCTALRDIYVGRTSAEFINWCVLSGVKVNLVTLHVPNQTAWTSYNKAENWNTIANIIVDPIPAASNDVLFAVMEDSEVKFESNTLPGSMEKGSIISFKASHIADNDNKMEVYANNTRLTSDAEGNYSVTLANNTIVHFNLTAPISIDSNKSPWTLTDKNGSIGLFSDAVNVIPGQEFTIRLNALNVPKGYDQMFWAAALTDKDGNIKEFISPVNTWTAGSADNFKLNVNCKVADSNVREGNQIRIVTSFNKKTWNLVKGASADITDALPALNNATPVYNINLGEVKNATVSGVTSTAVRGRDLTLKITPNSAAYRVDLTANGKPVAKGAASVSYPFVAMEDMNFEVNVYDPKAEGSVTFNVQPGELYKAVTPETVAANVIVTGEVYSKDLFLAFSQDFAARTIKRLDLSGVTIVANVLTPTSDNDKIDNFIPSNMLYNPSAIGAAIPVVEEIILPNTVTRIGEGAFTNCVNLKEIRLPESLSSGRIQVGTFASGSPKYGYPIGALAFKGCTSLTTIYIPGKLHVEGGKMVVSHFNPTGSKDNIWTMFNPDPYHLGHADISKVTIVVPQEYLAVYQTPYADYYYGNPWKGLGYNILSENPVYGVDFDPTRVKVVDDTDVTNMASFLGDNVFVESLKAEGKLQLVNPTTNCKVYDNGQEITPDENGFLSVEFFNPAKNAAKAGNHQIDVIYTYEVAFNSTSSLFEISTPEVDNENTYGFHSFDTTDALAPVLRDVAENSQVRFKVNFSDNNDGLEARVMNGNNELTVDEDGYYSLSVTNAAQKIDIFAVPGNGATINAEELAAIKPEESKGVTEIALAGEMSDEELAHAVECFPNLESLDLSGFEGELPEGAFKGMESLTTLVLPEVEEVPANLFSGCESLKSVDIPASVSSIGEGAFKGCSSLESLELTGVISIGARAFDGCDNLTTITLLADNNNSVAAVKGARKIRKAAALSSNAFKGLNPNCIVVLDQGVAMPEASANYLRTSTATLTETDAEGNEIEREGRVYSADSDINLVQGYALAIPHAFTLAEDAVISLETDTEDWTPVMVPFDVQTITDAGNTAMAFSLAEEGAVTAEGNLIYTLPAEGDALRSVEEVKANTPCFIRTAHNGKTIFAANGVKVDATPAEIKVEGKEYTLCASYAPHSVETHNAYFLTKDCSAFIPADSEEETVEVKPFEIYATSPVSVSEILTALPGTTYVPTGIEDVEFGADGLKVVKEAGMLVIYSADARTETIYAADGKAMVTVVLNEGRNVVKVSAPGLYIIGDTKVMF